MLETCTFLDWDSAFWGFPIARLNARSLTNEGLVECLAWCHDHDIRCLYFAATGTCAKTLALAANNGFRFVDVRIDLAVQIAGLAKMPAYPEQISVRHATQADSATLREFASGAHRDSRFFKDSRFDPERAAELYADWIRRDLSEHVVLTCTSSDNISRSLGYITCQRTDSREGRIGLLGVSSQFRRQGAGRALLTAAIDWFGRNNMDTVRVATQGTNVPALRLYETHGFRCDSVHIWFHRWFGPASE